MEGQDGGAQTWRRRPGFPLWLAIAAALLAWVPVLGVLLALAALVAGLLGLRHRPRQRFSSWAIALAVFGLLLGGSFTAIHLLLAPARETPAERRTREAFDRLFVPPTPPEGRPGPPSQ